MASPLHRSTGTHKRASTSKNIAPGVPHTSSWGRGVQPGTNSRGVAVHFETRDGQEPPFRVADVTLKTGLVDYYEMLQIPKAANQPEIKAAYRRLQKMCHPDILGTEHGHDMSILLNDAYTVLSNELTRELYDIDLNESKMEEEMGFTNEPISEWLPMTDPTNAKNTNPGETRAVFVDEVSCIGCKNCCFQASNTFILEAEHGRARCTKQWADPEDSLESAVESCPVRCIHWVEREELPVLEHVMASTPRVATWSVSTNERKGSGGNVFSMAEAFKKKKREGRVARKSWTEAFMYSRAQEAAMHRARSTEASGSLGALQRALAWARNGLWDIFGLGLERQGPEEGGPLANSAAEPWAGGRSAGAAGVLGSETESDTEAPAGFDADAEAVGGSDHDTQSVAAAVAGADDCVSSATAAAAAGAPVDHSAADGGAGTEGGVASAATETRSAKGNAEGGDVPTKADAH